MNIIMYLVVAAVALIVGVVVANYMSKRNAIIRQVASQRNRGESTP